MIATIKISFEIKRVKNGDWYLWETTDEILQWGCADKSECEYAAAILLAVHNNKPYKIGYKYYNDIISKFEGNRNTIDGYHIEGYIEDIPINPKIGDNCQIIDVDVYLKYGLNIRNGIVELKKIDRDKFFFVHPNIDRDIVVKRRQFKNITSNDKRAEFRLFPKEYQV